MNITRVLVLLLVLVELTGCVFTKVVTVPMRMTGAVVSVVPVVGNPADSVIDTAADTIDLIPF